MVLVQNSTRTFKKSIMETEGSLSNSFYKPHRLNQERELQTNLTHKHQCKNYQQNTSKPNPRTHPKKNHSS